MQRRRSWVILGLMALGIQGLERLLEAGKVPGEASRQLGRPPSALTSTLHPDGIYKHGSDKDFSSPKDGV